MTDFISVLIGEIFKKDKIAHDDKYLIKDVGGKYIALATPVTKSSLSLVSDMCMKSNWMAQKP